MVDLYGNTPPSAEPPAPPAMITPAPHDQQPAPLNLSLPAQHRSPLSATIQKDYRSSLNKAFAQVSPPRAMTFDIQTASPRPATPQEILAQGGSFAQYEEVRTPSTAPPPPPDAAPSTSDEPRRQALALKGYREAVTPLHQIPAPAPAVQKDPRKANASHLFRGFLKPFFDDATQFEFNANVAPRPNRDEDGGWKLHGLRLSRNTIPDQLGQPAQKDTKFFLKFTKKFDL